MMKRIANIGFTACLLLFLTAVALGTLLRNSGETSFFENRSLAAAPELTKEGLVSGDYFDRWEEWLTDHAVGRTTLLKLNTWMEMKLLNQPVVNDIVVTDEYLLGRNGFGRWDISHLEKNAAQRAAAYAELAAWIEEQGGVFCFVGLPEQYGYFSDKYPDYTENRKWYLEPMRETFFSAMEEANVTAIDMNAVFTEQGHPDFYYAASDHHYSYDGAKAAYEALIDHLNGEFGMKLPVAEVAVEALPNPFLGSRNRKLSGLWDGEDVLSVGVMEDEIPFRRWDNGKEVVATVYDLPATPEALVTYEVYMGGDKAETVIQTDRPELPNALVFGDSFTNAMETMLYASFNEMRSIDLRHYTEKTLREYIADYRPDVVICIRDETTYFSADGNGDLS